MSARQAIQCPPHQYNRRIGEPTHEVIERVSPVWGEFIAAQRILVAERYSGRFRADLEDAQGDV